MSGKQFLILELLIPWKTAKMTIIDQPYSSPWLYTNKVVFNKIKNTREKTSHPKVCSHFPIDFKMTTKSILLQLLMYFTLDIWKAKLLVNKIKCRYKFFTMDKYLLIFTPPHFFWRRGWDWNFSRDSENFIEMEERKSAYLQ